MSVRASALIHTCLASVELLPDADFPHPPTPPDGPFVPGACAGYGVWLGMPLANTTSPDAASLGASLDATSLDGMSEAAASILPPPPAATAKSAAKAATKIVLELIPQLDAILRARVPEDVARVEARTMEAHALLEPHHAEDVSEIKWHPGSRYIPPCSDSPLMIRLGSSFGTAHPSTSV
jgi:hypothetical protein